MAAEPTTLRTTNDVAARSGGTGYPKAPGRRRHPAKTVAVHLVMIILCFCFLVPVFWMLSASLKSRWEVFAWPVEWIPKEIRWANFRDAFTRVPMFRFIGNTFFLALVKIAGELLSVPLVAYAFARLSFPGKKILFSLLLMMMMIPLQTKLIPLYRMYSGLGMLDTYWPLIIPSFTATPFFVFLTVQYIKTMPRDLDDAARIDGVGTFGILYRILLPLCVPALTIVVTYTFMWTWNEFLQPLVYLTDFGKYTIQLGLEMFKGLWGVEWNLLMAATLVTMLPVLVLYFFVQKQLIGGIASLGLKG